MEAFKDYNREPAKQWKVKVYFTDHATAERNPVIGDATVGAAAWEYPIVAPDDMEAAKAALLVIESWIELEATRPEFCGRVRDVTFYRDGNAGWCPLLKLDFIPGEIPAFDDDRDGRATVYRPATESNRANFVYGWAHMGNDTIGGILANVSGT